MLGQQKIVDSSSEEHPSGYRPNPKINIEKHWVFANGKCQVAQPGDNRMQYDTLDECMGRNEPQNHVSTIVAGVIIGLIVLLLLILAYMAMRKK